MKIQGVTGCEEKEAGVLMLLYIRTLTLERTRQG